MLRLLSCRRWAAPGLLLAAVAAGCGNPGGSRDYLPRVGLAGRQRTTEELKASVGWLDPEAQEAGRGTLTRDQVLEFAERSRVAVKPPVPYPRKSILVITGGGSYGAYSAGVLVGWTAAGTRPEFDVVTGISTGALIGAFAFLGSSEDAELQRNYTTLQNRDIYHRNRLLPAILSESFADTRPLERLIERTATDERIARYAAEHAKGRRFYVGTSDLDARRSIVWDMGAIAARGTPQSRDLFRKVLLASASIPGFFPPVRIPVWVDGREYVERHIDGGTTSSMVFAPPWVPPDERAVLPPGWLHNSDLYILVAGKMYADPSPVRPRTIAIASAAVSTIIYDQTRSDLHKLFLTSAMTGLNYNVSVIPADLESPLESTEFEPKEMSKLFCAGYRWAAGGPRWRISPPGYEPGEGAKFRAGPILTATGVGATGGVLGPPYSRIPVTPLPLPMPGMGLVVPEK